MTDETKKHDHEVRFQVGWPNTDIALGNIIKMMFIILLLCTPAIVHLTYGAVW